VSEPLFTVLELAAVIALLRHLRSGALAWAVAAGAFAGLAVLTRPNGALLILVLAAAAGAGRSGGAGRRPAAVAAVLLAAGITVVP
jgi:4-amino-4-deoxy-L-arabinose transferase-like glycosyltransferase